MHHSSLLKGDPQSPVKYTRIVSEIIKMKLVINYCRKNDKKCKFRKFRVLIFLFFLRNSVKNK